MQATIDWSEEEEIPQASRDKSHVCGAFTSVASEETPSALSLHGIIQIHSKVSLKIRRALQTSTGVLKAERQTAKAPSEGQDWKLICYNCGKPGHISRKCIKSQGKHRQATAFAYDVSSGVPDGQADGSISTGTVSPITPTPVLMAGHSAMPGDAFGNCFTVDVSIGGMEMCCLLDTRSEVTTISETHFRGTLQERHYLQPSG